MTQTKAITAQEKSYQKYLKQPHHMGFDPFPVIDILDKITIAAKCRTYDVTFDVKYARVCLSDMPDVEFFAIETTRVEISHRLPLNGYNSNCCYDEAETMELGVIEMAKKHDLLICDKKTSWPYAQAVVQEWKKK